MDDLEAEAALEVFEPDRFVSLFYVPRAHRPSVRALYVFEMELSRIATQVAEPMVGQIRYALWREQIEALYAGRKATVPAAQALAPVIGKYDLPRLLFDEMIDAHALDCDGAPFPTMVRMSTYAARTAGNVMKLGARVLGAGSGADAAAVLAGTAYGLSRQLHEFSHWASHRRLRLPLELVEGQGLRDEDVFSGALDRERLRPVFVAVKREIGLQLSALNSSRFPNSSAPVLAIASCARHAGRDGFNPLEPAAVSPAARIFRCTVANLLWRF